MSKRDDNMKKTVRTDHRLNSFDQLNWMTDDELVSLNMTLERDREGMISRGRNPRNVEVELCYVQREWDIRNTRRAAHSAWLASMGAEMTDAKAAN